jgi:putative lipoic acid-binding regulatory protein
MACAKIEFPCDYVIKVIATNHVSLKSSVLEIVREHDSHFRDEKVTLRDSRHARYCSVSVTIRATGEPQLKALHKDLMANPLVKMVL